MLRRRFSGLAISIVLTFFTFVGAGGNARAAECEPTMTPRGPAQICSTSGIDPNDVPIAIQPSNSFWCWAASLSMIFTYEGHAISQEEIVQQVYGSVDIHDSSGPLGQFVRTMNRSFVDDDRNTFHSHSRRVFDNLTVLRVLDSGTPILYTTHTHAMVLAQANWLATISGQPLQIIRATLFDPEVGPRNQTFYDMANYMAAWAITTTDD